MKWSAFGRSLPLAALLSVALVVGVITAPHYGESWDEHDIRRYSQHAIDAYHHLLRPGEVAPFETNLNLYGPAYFMAAGLLARLITALAPAWSTITAWHAVYFITFLAGALFLYLLAGRWMGEWAAFGAALLFITQPLFWGHAFINPKDVAFLAFFLATVYLGLRMVDDIAAGTGMRLSLVVAAILLGVTSSLRVLGPLAGLIVLAHAAWSRRAAAVIPAALYLILAALTMYLSWPYLWGAPVSRFIESLSTMADFPFNSTVLFAGQLYKPTELPVTYFPTLLALQLTESALLIIAAGLVVSVINFIAGRNRAVLALLVAWFLLPLLVIVAARSPLYDNGRQLYFLLPPLFIAGGAALDRLFERLRLPGLRGAVLMAAALPGILIGARLHPYEYVYYNALVKGTGGAFRSYETDYWGTSFDEISAYINVHLPAGSKVLVYGPEQIVAARARTDLAVFIPREHLDPGYDYVVLLTRSNADQRLCRGTETIFSVGRRGAVFSELRRIPAGEKCR